MCDSGDDLALSLGEFLEKALPLVLAELLNHHLLGRLGWDSAERFEFDYLARIVISVTPNRDLTTGAVDVTAERF